MLPSNPSIYPNIEKNTSKVSDEPETIMSTMNWPVARNMQTHPDHEQCRSHREVDGLQQVALTTMSTADRLLICATSASRSLTLFSSLCRSSCSKMPCKGTRIKTWQTVPNHNMSILHDDISVFVLPTLFHPNTVF